MAEQPGNSQSNRPPETTGQPYTERTPYNQQAGQSEGELLRAVHEPGNEDDPERTNVIPQPTTGERRWVRGDLGALDSEGGHDWTNQVGTMSGPGTPVASSAGGASDQGEWPPIGGDQNQDWNPQEYAIQGDMMSGGPTVQGAPFADGMPARAAGAPAGNDGFLEQGIEGPPDEAYGQGLTRQFAPRGAEPGVDQQDVLQSQQYEREERRSEQGMLGAVGDMLGGLFGNAKRTPDDDDEGEAAGEAHP